MKSHHHSPRTDSGAAMLVALLLVFATTIAITAWMSMLTSRLRQSEANNDTVFRHVGWGNTAAVNLTYAHYQGYKDNSTQAAAETTVTTGSGASTLNWGGISSSGWTSLSVFRTTQRPVGATFAYPYNNLQPIDTADHAVYFERTDVASDTMQSEHLSLYNYLMSYPSPLLGDLLIIHRAASGASGTYSINSNTTVNGRVVIWDKTATTGNVRATSVQCRYTSGTSAVTVKNTGGTASIMPENMSICPSSTAGVGGSANTPGATDGTLTMCDNANFTAGSLYHIITSSAFGTYTTWNGLGNNGTTADPSYSTQVNKTSATYVAPTTTPYNYSPVGQMNTLWVDLQNASLNNLVVTGNFEQVVLKGTTTQTQYNTQDTLSPIIILIEEDALRDIRFVGENNRRVILGIKKTTTNTVYMGFSGSSAVIGGPLRWRLNLVNEYGALWVDPPSGNNVSLTGSVRTNWQFNCTDSTSTQRIILNEETSPSTLETMLPRDSYFTSYVLVR